MSWRGELHVQCESADAQCSQSLLVVNALLDLDAGLPYRLHFPSDSIQFRDMVVIRGSLRPG